MKPDQIITQLDSYQARLFVKTPEGRIEPAAPGVLSTNLLLIRGLLVQLVDVIANTERSYRKAKAIKFDELIKSGVKKSPAFELLELDPELIDQKIDTERFKNYTKYVDGLCTSVQSVLKVQSSSDKNQY
jgi:hypothetical protein